MDTGMIFAIIFAIIFIGFLLAYGVNQIQGLFCLTEQANTLRAVKDLQTVAEGLSTKAQGSSDLYRLSIPANSRVCFFDPNDWSENLNHYDQDRAWDPTEDAEVYYQLGNNFTEGYGSNVWVFYCGGDMGFKIKNLIPYEGTPGNEGNFCAPAGTEFYLLNAGAQVNISVNE